MTYHGDENRVSDEESADLADPHDHHEQELSVVMSGLSAADLFPLSWLGEFDLRQQCLWVSPSRLSVSYVPVFFLR